MTRPDPTPGKLLWFTLVGCEGAREGGHGFDSERSERPLTGVGKCAVTKSLPLRRCRRLE